MTPSPEAPGSLNYRDAYARLARIAQELDDGEADLDRVLPLLEEARDAYAACRARIEAVRAVLAGDWGSSGAALNDEDQVTPDDPTDDPDD